MSAAEDLFNARAAEITGRAITDDDEVAARLAGEALWRFLRASDEITAGEEFARFVRWIPASLLAERPS